MWILVFIVLAPLPGMDRVHQLEVYQTKQTCLHELNRVMEEMTKAYGNDPDWTLQCRPKGIQM